MIDVVEIQKILPHRYPLLLIDRVVDMEQGKSIEAYKNNKYFKAISQGILFTLVS